MSKCPSKFCDGELGIDPKCPKCGIRTDLDPEEIKARDIIFEAFNEFLKLGKLKTDLKEITRTDIDSFVENKGAKMALNLLINSGNRKEVQEPPKPKGLYGLFLDRLYLLDRSKEGVIHLHDVYMRLCRQFSMTKEQCHEIILVLRDFGFVEITKRGIRVL